MYRYIFAYDKLADDIKDEHFLKSLAYYKAIKVVDNCWVIDTNDKISYVRDQIIKILGDRKFVLAEVSINMPKNADNYHMFVSPQNDDISCTLD